MRPANPSPLWELNSATRPIVLAAHDTFLRIISEDSNQAIAWLREKYGINNPSEVEIVIAAGGIAVAAEDYEKATRYFDQVPTEIPRFGMTARLEQGVALLKLDFATPAEQNLRNF